MSDLIKRISRVAASATWAFLAMVFAKYLGLELPQEMQADIEALIVAVLTVVINGAIGAIGIKLPAAEKLLIFSAPAYFDEPKSRFRK